MDTFWLFKLWFPRAFDSTYNPDFWFSLDHKVSYNSNYDSDSIASENKP